MSTGSILLGAALLVLVGLFLARPLLLSETGNNRQRSLRQQLLAQKENILAQIQVLEFDYETGTLPELDFKQQRRRLVEEAAAVLHKLDELPAAPAETGSRADKEIEAAVAQLRRRAARQTEPQPMKAAPAKAAPEPPTPKPAVYDRPQAANGRVKFCAQCGRPVEEGDNFCAYCGYKIIHPQPT